MSKPDCQSTPFLPAVWAWLAAALSGALLAASFPNLNLGWLAWVGMVPLLLAIRGRSFRQAMAVGWLAGFVFFVLALYWIAPTISGFTRLEPVVGWLLCALLALVASYGFAGFAGGLEWLGARGVPRMFGAPVVWVVMEWSRNFVIAAFPWASLGYSQHRNIYVLQLSDLGSVYGISALLVLTNVALAGALADRRRALARVLTVLVVQALVFTYGGWRLAQLDRLPVEGVVSVGFVQGNIPQDEKWRADLRQRNLERYLELSMKAAGAGAELIVWPEAAAPFDMKMDRRSSVVRDLARELKTQMLVGAPGYECDGDRYPACCPQTAPPGTRPGPECRKAWTSFNRAWSVTSGGQLDGPYDKIQLVPFGEYVPLSAILGDIDIVVEAVGRFGSGGGPMLFDGPPVRPPDGGDPVRDTRFGVLICYEGIFPALTRQFAALGADFLVNISNDAWYGETSAPYQHLAMASMRAVENRVPLVRATNTGVSAFVGADGRIGGWTSLFEPAGGDYAVERLLVRKMGSFYRSFGDVFVYFCLLLLFGLWFFTRRSEDSGRAN